MLFTWIDRGEVNRRTANHFYSMIQSANSHVRRLMSEKAQHEEELECAKEIFKNALVAILTQCKEAYLFSTHLTSQNLAGRWHHIGTVNQVISSHDYLLRLQIVCSVFHNASSFNHFICYRTIK